MVYTHSKGRRGGGYRKERKGESKEVSEGRDKRWAGERRSEREGVIEGQTQREGVRGKDRE